MSIRERKKLSKYLKHGDLILIANKSGLSVNAVSKWVNGHFENSGCETYFEALVAKRKKEVLSSMSKV